MTSLAVTVFYKDQFYSEHCLPLRPNATLPDHCHQVNSTNALESDVADDGYRDNLVLVFDIWPALSVILYILGRIVYFWSSFWLRKQPNKS